MPRFIAPVFAATVAVTAALATLALGKNGPSSPAPVARAASTWTAKGTLLESCTCAVPCSCNFGEGPSPHDYCHAVFAYKLDSGSAWGAADLGGLIFGGADGPKGNLGFLDERATPAQQAALRRVAEKVFAQGGPASGPRAWETAKITHSVNGNDLRLGLGNSGGFSARVIVGRDGKTPVVVENNTVWPIARAVKGKANPLQFRDPRVGTIRGDGSNANYGAFSFSGPTGGAATVTARTAPASIPVAKRGACCAGK